MWIWIDFCWHDKSFIFIIFTKIIGKTYFSHLKISDNSKLHSAFQSMFCRICERVNSSIKDLHFIHTKFTWVTSQWYEIRWEEYVKIIHNYWDPSMLNFRLSSYFLVSFSLRRNSNEKSIQTYTAQMSLDVSMWLICRVFFHHSNEWKKSV